MRDQDADNAINPENIDDNAFFNLPPYLTLGDLHVYAEAYASVLGAVQSLASKDDASITAEEALAVLTSAAAIVREIDTTIELIESATELSTNDEE
jgi:hypothetical protein